jgi:hypothetical protein
MNCFNHAGNHADDETRESKMTDQEFEREIEGMPQIENEIFLIADGGDAIHAEYRSYSDDYPDLRIEMNSIYGDFSITIGFDAAEQLRDFLNAKFPVKTS